MQMSLPWAAIALLYLPSAVTLSTKAGALGLTADPTHVPICVASLRTTLCGYDEPGLVIAVDSGGQAQCMEYCLQKPPCKFYIFQINDSRAGTGVCWLNPGDTFNTSAGVTGDCRKPKFQVYAEPACTTVSQEIALPTQPSSSRVCHHTCEAQIAQTACTDQCLEITSSSDTTLTQSVHTESADGADMQTPSSGAGKEPADEGGASTVMPTRKIWQLLILSTFVSFR